MWPETAAVRTPVRETDARTVRFRRLGPDDRMAAARLAGAAFRGNRFYERAIGLDAAAFDAFWDLFFELALADSHSRVFGLDWGDDLVAVVVSGFERFPESLRGLRFLGALLRCIGPRRWVRYLRFVAAYDRAMRRRKAEREIEARGLWLMVQPDAGRAGLGSRLVNGASEALRLEGKVLITGFVDAGDPRLRAFYERLGFAVGPGFVFRGGMAALIERRSTG